MCFFSKNARVETKSVNVRGRGATETQLQGIPYPSSAGLLEAALPPLSRQVTATNDRRGGNAYSV